MGSTAGSQLQGPQFDPKLRVPVCFWLSKDYIGFQTLPFSNNSQ